MRRHHGAASSTPDRAARPPPQPLLLPPSAAALRLSHLRRACHTYLLHGCPPPRPPPPLPTPRHTPQPPLRRGLPSAPWRPSLCSSASCPLLRRMMDADLHEALNPDAADQPRAAGPPGSVVKLQQEGKLMYFGCDTKRIACVARRRRADGAGAGEGDVGHPLRAILSVPGHRRRRRPRRLRVPQHPHTRRVGVVREPPRLRELAAKAGDERVARGGDRACAGEVARARVRTAMTEMDGDVEMASMTELGGYFSFS